MNLVLKLFSFLLISLTCAQAATPANLVPSDSIVLLARGLAEQISSENDSVVGIYSCFRFKDFDSVFGLSAAADNSIPKRPMSKLRGTGDDSARDPVPGFLRIEKLHNYIELGAKYKDRTAFNLKKILYGVSPESVIIKMRHTLPPIFPQGSKATLFTGIECESFLLILRKDIERPEPFFMFL
jgi:hypothetical protein